MQLLNARRRARLSVYLVLALGVLLIVPSVAAYRLAVLLNPYFVGGYFLLISGITYWYYRDDKNSALLGRQRTPEYVLHFAELLGGWPGAFLAQRILRHKIVKIRYQIVFWLIIGLHEFTSFDFVCGWRYSRQFLSYLFGSV